MFQNLKTSQFTEPPMLLVILMVSAPCFHILSSFLRSYVLDWPGRYSIHTPLESPQRLIRDSSEPILRIRP